jgi:glycosyltransferase involved in cell wall biosynthesis
MKNNRIRVLMLIGALDRDSGGAQRLILNLVSNADRERFRFTVCHMFGDGSLGPLFPEDVEIISLHAGNKLDPRIPLALKRIISERRIQIIHTNSPISGIWARLIQHICPVSGVVSTEQNVHQRFRHVARWINGLTLNWADSVVGVSDSVTNSFLWWEKALLSKDGKVTTIHNGIDIAQIEAGMQTPRQKKRRELGLAEDDLVVGNVARLSWEKGQKHLIEALAELAPRYRNAKLLIIGRGELKDDLMRRAHDLGVHEKVILTGGRNDVYDLLPVFDLFAFPSIHEGFSVALLEAMVAGIPIVGSSIPPIAEAVGGCAILASPRDSYDLARAISDVFENPAAASERASKARRRVEERFSIEATAERYTRIYLDLIAEA